MLRRLVLFLAFFVILAQPALAADSTPPATPAVADCKLAPLAPDALVAIVAEPARPAPESTPATDNARAEDVAAATETVEQSLACTNANLPLAALAAYTDRYLAERFSGSSGAAELGHLLAEATRDPDPAAPEDVVTLVEVTNPVMYGDGRLGLTVVTANATDRYVDRLIFVREGDRWLINQVIFGDDEPIATPVSPVAEGPRLVGYGEQERGTPRGAFDQ